MAILLRHTCCPVHRVRQQAGSYELCVSPASRRLQTLRSPKVAGVALINCRSALAREGDGAAAHLSSDPPRSPASRLLQILLSPDQAGACRLCVRRRLPVMPGSTVGARLPANGDFAATHLSSDPPRSPASRLLRTLHFPASRRLQNLRSPKFTGVARIDCRSALAREWRFCCNALVA
jgi:hypothetical protein